MLNKMNKKKKGFTLIELVIVLAVLAIIGLIAIPNFTKVREDSQIKADERSLEAIAKIIDMEIIEETIPDTSNGTVTFSFPGGAATGTLAFVLTDGAGAAITIAPADITDIQNNGLSKVGAPQEKNKTNYVMTLSNGEIVTTSMITN